MNLFMDDAYNDTDPYRQFLGWFSARSLEPGLGGDLIPLVVLPMCLVLCDDGLKELISQDDIDAARNIQKLQLKDTLGENNCADTIHAEK